MMATMGEAIRMKERRRILFALRQAPKARVGQQVSDVQFRVLACFFQKMAMRVLYVWNLIHFSESF